MKALFVTPAPQGAHTHFPPDPPLAIGYLSAVLKQIGIATAWLDLCPIPPVQRNGIIDTTINRLKPDMICLSPMTFTALSAHKIAAQVKSLLPEARVVLGGCHVSALPEDSLSDPNIDFVVKGEGETSIAALAMSFVDGHVAQEFSGPGHSMSTSTRCITMSNSPAFDLASLPIPHWPAREWGRETGIVPTVIPVATSRGCPYGCSFCAAQVVMGKNPRFRSVEHVVAEVRHWCSVSSANTVRFSFVDDTFTLSPERVAALLSALRNECLPISWSCFIRADTFESWMSEALAISGCTNVFVGIESLRFSSGNQAKKASHEQITHIRKCTADYGIAMKGSIIIGMPNQTVEDVEYTIEAAAGLMLDEIAINYLTPFPGTSIWASPATYGLRITDRAWEHYDGQHIVTESQWIDTEQAAALFSHAKDIICGSAGEA